MSIAINAGDTEPRVWIGSLAAYNAGRLIGEWVDATDEDVLDRAAKRVLAEGGGEEIALMDREGFGNTIGEYTQLSKVAEIGAAIEEHGEPLVLYAANQGWCEGDGDGDVHSLVQDFQDHYIGSGWESLRAYAEEDFHEMFEVPDSVAPYIDYDAYANTLDTSGYWIESRHLFKGDG